MAKQLTFTYKDVEYTLEYTRKTVMEMERKGFVVSDIESKPMTTLPQMFEGAFLAHHRGIKKHLPMEIYENLTNKEDLLGKLAEMYNDPIMTLVNDPDNEEGNVSWTANW